MQRLSVRGAWAWRTIAVAIGLLLSACSGAAASPEPSSTTTSVAAPTTVTASMPDPTTPPSTTTTAPPPTTTPTTTTVPPTVHAISMTEYANAPLTITVAAGGIVRWVNDGALDHNVRSGSDPVEDGSWGSFGVEPGSSWSITFDTPGNYNYFCSLHPTLMPGTVVVNP